MRKYLPIALTLAAFVIGGAPAFAQSYNPEMGTGNVLSPAPPQLAPAPETRGLYNYAPRVVKPVKRHH